MIESILDRDQFKFIYSKPFQSLTVNGVKALAMFALVKLLAAYGGASSLASFSNFQNLIGLMSVFVTMSLQTGLTIETARNISDKDPLITCISVILIMTPFVFLGLYVSLDSLVLANDPLSADSYFLYLTALILPFSANSILVASEVGRQRYYNILVNYILVGFFPCLTFVIAGDETLVKVIIGLCVGNLVGAIFLCWRIRVAPALFFRLKFRKKLLISMFSYGVTGFAMGSLSAITALVTRQYLSDEISVDVAGQWDALFKVGVLFQFVIAAPLISTMLPLMVRALEAGSKDIYSLLVTRMKSLLILIALSITISWLLADWIVLILFSKEFLPISQLIVWIVIIESFRTIGTIFLQVPWANRQLGIVFLIYLISTIIFLGGLYFLSLNTMLTLQNITWLYLGSSVIYCILLGAWTLIWLHKRSKKELITSV